jgi:hypothetical protein
MCYAQIMTILNFKIALDQVEGSKFGSFLSMLIIQILTLLAIIYITIFEISRWHILWLVVVWFLLMLLNAFSFKIIERGIVYIIIAFVLTIILGVLTYIQWGLINEEEILVIVNIGRVPIPLLGITFVLTCVAAFFGIICCINGVIYLIVRLIFGNRQRL